MGKCSVDNCEANARKRGMCHKHYMQVWRRGDIEVTPHRLPRPPKTRTNSPAKGHICKVEGCEKGVRAKGLCVGHYCKKRRGTLGQVKQRKTGVPCKVISCPDLARSLGYCIAHYQRYRRYGDPLGGYYWLSERLYTQLETPCRDRGCNSPIQARGMCWKHYRRWLREHNKQNT